MVKPEWTRVRPSLRQKSIVDCYNRYSADCSIRDCACRHYRYRMFRPLSSMVELGRTTKNGKRVIIEGGR